MLRSLVLMIVLMLPGTVVAIDCTKAISNDKKAICTNTTLQQLDTLLNGIYTSNRQHTHKEILKVQQKSWLNKRKQCEKDLTCLSDAYVSRIKDLTAPDSISASISVIHKVSNQWDFFLIASGCTQDGGVYGGIYRTCEGPTTLNIFSKGKNKLVQNLSLEKTYFILNKEDETKTNLVEDRENDSNFGMGMGASNYFSIGDINFDGFDDLVLADSNEGGYGSQTYSIFLYHPENRKFIKNEEFTEKLGQSNTGLFDIDRKSKTLTTRWKDGCCFNESNTWQMRNNKLVLVKEVTDTYTDDYSHNWDINVTTTRELIHGKWKTTTTKTKQKLQIVANPSALRRRLKKYNIIFNLHIFLVRHMEKDYILARWKLFSTNQHLG